jgi:hypothetical protein
MSRLLLQRCGTIRFLAHEQGVVKMAWFGDLCLKQRAVIEFVVAEKESITNIHRRLKNVYGDNAVDKSTLIAGLHGLRVLRKAKRSSGTRLALADQQKQSLRRCSNLLMN